MAMKAHKTPASAALAEQVLADALAQREAAAGPFVLAISGLQGSGKTTLAAAVTATAQAHGLDCGDRVAGRFLSDPCPASVVGRLVHPLLLTRGPPGTHDLALAHQVLDAVSLGRPVRLPRFDKLADDRVPEADWPLAPEPLDLLVMEGWCLGVPAQADVELQPPLNALERDEDPQAHWRRYVNDALSRHYPALWRRFDRLCVLQAPSFEVVSAWRWQQEQALVARRAAADSGQRTPACSRHSLRVFCSTTSG